VGSILSIINKATRPLLDYFIDPHEMYVVLHFKGFDSKFYYINLLLIVSH